MFCLWKSQMENECINIVPGEGRQPKSILNDKFWEKLSFPHLFPKGKFGYKVKRNINLRPLTCFNERLLHFSQKFASDTDYIFFARNVLRNLSMQKQINVAMRKISTPVLKAGFFDNTSLMEAARDYVETDQAFTFMNSIKGTPTYWKKIKSEVLALMVKQLGAIFFLTLSCADLRWDELIEIMQKLSKVDKVDVDMSNL